MMTTLSRHLENRVHEDAYLPIIRVPRVPISCGYRPVPQEGAGWLLNRLIPQERELATRLKRGSWLVVESAGFTRELAGC